MADLRALLEALGYGDVRTHLQSGNALFTTTNDKPDDRADETVAERLEQEISARIASELGLDVTVLVRSAGELATVVGANPFAARPDVGPKELHVAFLSEAPPPGAVARATPDAYRPDEFAIGDRAIYLRRPNGIQGNKLPDWSKLFGVDVTERNWNTVTRLHQLTTGPQVG